MFVVMPDGNPQLINMALKNVQSEILNQVFQVAEMFYGIQSGNGSDDLYVELMQCIRVGSPLVEIQQSVLYFV